MNEALLEVTADPVAAAEYVEAALDAKNQSVQPRHGAEASAEMRKAYYASTEQLDGEDIPTQPTQDQPVDLRTNVSLEQWKNLSTDERNSLLSTSRSDVKHVPSFNRQEATPSNGRSGAGIQLPDANIPVPIVTPETSQARHAWQRLIRMDLHLRFVLLHYLRRGRKSRHRKQKAIPAIVTSLRAQWPICLAAGCQRNG